MPSKTVLLTISEEYGYRNWYAVLTRAEYEQVCADWKTLKGLNCLVPVRFLIPQAKPLWILRFTPEHAFTMTVEGLAGMDVEIVGAHIHESDDSGLGGVDYSIPEQETFEFKGKAYTYDAVLDLFQADKDLESVETDKTLEEHPELATDPVVTPQAWHEYSDNVPKFELTKIMVWPEDMELPSGFERTEDGTIIKKE
jgi:hypothetical protein